MYIRTQIRQAFSCRPFAASTFVLLVESDFSSTAGPITADHAAILKRDKMAIFYISYDTSAPAIYFSIRINGMTVTQIWICFVLFFECQGMFVLRMFASNPLQQSRRLFPFILHIYMSHRGHYSDERTNINRKKVARRKKQPNTFLAYYTPRHLPYSWCLTVIS